MSLIPTRPAAAAATLLAAMLSAPRASEANPPAPSGGSGVTVAPDLITDAPYEIPSLGLSVFLPKDSLVDLSRVQGGRTSVMVRPQGTEMPWVVQIHNSVSSDHGLTLKVAMDNIISQRQGQFTRRLANGRTESLVRVFGRTEELTIGPYPAERVYVDVPSRQDVPVTGYTLFQTGPGQFVIFQIDCLTSAFPALQTMYETMVATVQFRDPTELHADRAAAILAGKALLQQFNSSDLKAALDPEPRFYRLYKPAGSGAASDAQEVGYQRIQARLGRAGDLDPGKPQSSWTAADRQPGYIVRIDARTLSLDAVIDSVSIYFLSDDRNTELWSNTMEVRTDRASERWVETGIRRENRLTVKTVRSGAEPTQVDWSPTPDGYISRVEAYLLPRLVVQADTPGSFGFYSYESALGKMTLRRDSYERSPTGAWTATLQQSENSPPMSSSLDAEGRLLRRQLPDGTVVEPTDAQRLRRIWKDKKLPLD